MTGIPAVFLAEGHPLHGRTTESTSDVLMSAEPDCHPFCTHPMPWQEAGAEHVCEYTYRAWRWDGTMDDRGRRVFRPTRPL